MTARLAFVVGALSLMATSGVAAQARIPIRTLAPSVSTDSGALDAVSVIRALADGRVLLNDASRRRLLLFDSTLKRFKILADTAGESQNTFGTANGGLLPFLGDSTAFVDQTSRALVIVTQAGAFGRTIAPPNVSDIRFYVSSTYGVPGFDAKGRLFYRAAPFWELPETFQFGAKDTTFAQPDTAPIIRADFERRRIDTIAMLHVPALRSKTFSLPGRMGLNWFVNPLPVTDEWAYFEDGTVAIVRGHDYHIDWISPEGKKKSTPAMPFDWRRLTDDDKQRIVDSTQRQLDSTFDAAAQRAMAANSVAANREPPRPRPAVVNASELPDFYPSIKTGTQVRADPSGNLWILPSTSSHAKGGLLYDVVNRGGEIIERVQFPEGRALAGFGRGGAVYMVVLTQYAWARLERTRVVRP